MTIVHVITGLGNGGAEHMLMRLIGSLKARGITCEVVSLTSVGPVGTKLMKQGVPVHALNWKGSVRDFINGFYLLIKVIRETQPEVIQGWMYHGNLIALFLRIFLARKSCLFWNIRQGLDTIEHEKKSTVAAIRANSALSRVPSGIIYNSRKSAEQHERIGFSRRKRIYIPNGFNLEVSNSILRGKDVGRDVRDSKKVLIGHVGRFHPKKGHHILLQATRLVCDQIENVSLVCVGRDVSRKNAALMGWISTLMLEKKSILVGECDDVQDMLSCLDLLVCSSPWGEGFPNVVAEAMALGVLCVSTDVGEARDIIGDTGLIVPVDDADALSQAIVRMLRISPQENLANSSKAKNRISEKFGIEKITDSYLSEYTRFLC